MAVVRKTFSIEKEIYDAYLKESKIRKISLSSLITETLLKNKLTAKPEEMIEDTNMFLNTISESCDELLNNNETINSRLDNLQSVVERLVKIIEGEK